MANIAFWLKRSYRFDPEKEEIIGDPKANRWIDRPMGRGVRPQFSILGLSA